MINKILRILGIKKQITVQIVCDLRSGKFEVYPPGKEYFNGNTKIIERKGLIVTDTIEEAISFCKQKNFSYTKINCN